MRRSKRDLNKRLAVVSKLGTNSRPHRDLSATARRGCTALHQGEGVSAPRINSIVNRYVKDPKFVKSALGDDGRKRFGAAVDLFRKYGDQYDIDYLLMMAQRFQESGLDQNAKSPVGAMGIMQVMPATGKDLKVGDIGELESNVRAGVKCVRFVIDQFHEDEPMTPLNKGLYAFASYNAGRTASRSYGARLQSAGSTRIAGLTTSSWSRRTRSNRKRSPTSATSTSITSHTSSSWRRTRSGAGRARV
jgi:hypothetical protein